MKLVKAGTSDTVILVAISKHAFDSDIGVGAPSAGGPPGYKSIPFHMKMARSGKLYKLVDENGMIVGGAVLFPDKDKLCIGRIFVAPEHFRKGYGEFIMNEVEALFPETKEFLLDTPIWNTRTNAFYTKLGYEEVRRDKEFIYYSKKVR
ncbi:MAG: GNAT family N-acetyltransferase [Clostridiales bacterium]|nr:GNAT family N-acetyltransferase [Clostridiales bacterium]